VFVSPLRYSVYHVNTFYCTLYRGDDDVCLSVCLSQTLTFNLHTADGAAAVAADYVTPHS